MPSRRRLGGNRTTALALLPSATPGSNAAFAFSRYSSVFGKTAHVSGNHRLVVRHRDDGRRRGRQPAGQPAGRGGDLRALRAGAHLDRRLHPRHPGPQARPAGEGAARGGKRPRTVRAGKRRRRARPQPPRDPSQMQAANRPPVLPDRCMEARCEKNREAWRTVHQPSPPSLPHTPATPNAPSRRRASPGRSARYLPPLCGGKMRARPGILCAERLPDLLAHLEGGRTDARAQPRQHAAFRIQARERLLQHATGQAAPAERALPPRRNPGGRSAARAGSPRP